MRGDKVAGPFADSSILAATMIANFPAHKSPHRQHLRSPRFSRHDGDAGRIL
jgi:hypothetical protein